MACRQQAFSKTPSTARQKARREWCHPFYPTRMVTERPRIRHERRRGVEINLGIQYLLKRSRLPRSRNSSELEWKQFERQHGHRHQRTSFGAIKDDRVSRFSGGIPVFTAAMTTTVSPLMTSFTTPLSHPSLGAVIVEKKKSRKMPLVLHADQSGTSNAVSDTT